MKRLQHLVLAAGIFGAMLLSSCSQYSIYGTYSFSMGSNKGTHFYVAMVLSDDPSTDSSGAEAGRKAFTFDYANVSSSSSSSSSSEESSSSDESSATSSEVTSSSSESTSSESTSSADSSSTSSTTSLTSSNTFVTDANGELKELHLTGDWAYYDESASSESSASAVSSSESSSVAASSEATSSEATSTSKAAHVGQRLDLNFFLLPEDTGEKELVVVPFSITKYFLDVSIDGKYANVIIPVSFNDALEKLLEIIIEGKDPESITIHTVTITLTKEDKVNL
jgi:hypothetical protein